jgi:ketosteroid isomerase-like protein
MSRENVEVVRRSLEAFARGDFETAFAAHAPDVEWHTAVDEPDTQTYRGIEGLRRFVVDISELWHDRFGGAQRFEDFIDLGDWVIAPWSARFRGRISGIEMTVHETYAVQLSRGKIVRVDEYRTREEALKAAAVRADLG